MMTGNVRSARSKNRGNQRKARRIIRFESLGRSERGSSKTGTGCLRRYRIARMSPARRCHTNAGDSVIPGDPPASYERGPPLRRSGGLSDRAAEQLLFNKPPEVRVEPRAHVVPGPAGPDGPELERVPHPLVPASPLVVLQETALAHVEDVGAEGQEIVHERDLRAGSGGGLIDGPDQLRSFDEDLADPVELLIDVVEHPGLEVDRKGLDLPTGEVDGHQQRHDDRERLDQAQ